MKFKKLIIICLLAVLLASQFGWLDFSNIVHATESQVVDETELIGKFHYDQLKPEAKKIYQGMYSMYKQGMFERGTERYDLVENGMFTEDEIKEYEKGNASLTSAMNAARYAFYADFPEVFYVNFQKLSLRTTKDMDEKYHVYISSGRYADYYTEGFTNETQVQQAIVEFNSSLDEIAQKAQEVEAVENQSRTMGQIKLVHNELINNTGYRLESDCVPGNEGFISTPYGALVKKEAVCEGYARAFKAALDKVGINSILVQGTHQSQGAAAVPHMWNYVEVEKETNARSTEKVWYAVDSTLDDPFLRDTTMDTTDPEFVPGSDIQEGFENTRYCMVGTETMDKEHIALETVEAAGNYTFKYPQLNLEDYGMDSITNVNGLLVKFKQEGTETEEYKAGDFYISYNGKGYAAAKAEGKYILMKYHEYRPGDDIWLEGKWGYMDPTYYAGGFKDNGDYIYITVPNSEYVEFAVTTLEPSGTDLEKLTYQGNGSDFVAQSGKLYNPNGTYKAPPYIKYQTPPPTATLTVGPTYHVDVTYDDDLVLAEGATQIGYRMESTGATGAAKSEITNFVFDGKRRVTFDLKFSKMFADDNAMYRIYLTGVVGRNSGKEPNHISYGASNIIGCSTRMNAAKNWEVFATPTLLENEDLSMNGWLTSDGKPVSDKLKSRIALVTTRTNQTEKESMDNLMEEELGEQGLITSETYNISLNVCKKYVVKTGHRLRLSLGFPAGYGPDDAGVTFKAYHFMRDDEGNVTGVEEIPCVVTPYGLIVTCDSFSPFAVAVTENDGTVSPNKSIVVSATEGGIIEGANREEGNIVTLAENDSATLQVIPEDGYEIETVTVCGEQKEVTDKNAMDITVNYNDVKDGNCIVEATFVAKTVTEREENSGETVVVPTAVPAEIKMPKTQTATLNETLRIEPEVSVTPGVQTYQWYKDDVKLEGKTNKILEIQNCTKADAGNYVLKVTSTVETTCEEVTSTPCTVTFTVVPTFETLIEKASSSPEEIRPEDEFEVDVKIDHFENIEEGLISLGGQLEYDSNVLEKIKVTENQSQWNTGVFNEENFKFVTDAEKLVTEAGRLFTVKFKVKDTVTAPMKTTVTVKNIVASDGEKDISSQDASLEINIQKRMDAIESDKYLIEGDIISRIVPNTKVSDFKNNVQTYQEMIFTDKNGNVLGDDAKLATGTKLQVGDTLHFTLVVIADIDGNGEITITDLAKLKLHYIEQKLLTGVYLKAADINNDGGITITDLAQLKLVLIGSKVIQ